MCLLAGKDSLSKMVVSSVVEQKGDDEFAIKLLVGFITLLGYKKMIFESDNEPAISKLESLFSKELPDVQLVPQETPTGNHQANGDIESLVRVSKGGIRAMKSSVDSKWVDKYRIPEDHPMMAWIPRHVAFCCNRFRIGADGKSAYERHYGREWRRPMVLFGEKLVYAPLSLISVPGIEI